MTENKYIKGSEWRKWDLHIHTPSSIIQHYGGETPEVWEKFIKNLENLPSEYKAIGINDYIYLDGYKRVLEYKKQGRLANIDLIIPVIELRVDKFASIGDEAWKKINLHILFSNEIKPEIIEAQFLSAIQHSIKISPDIEGVDFKGVATKEALEEIGKKIKETSTVEIQGSDLKVGFWNIFFDYKTVIDITKGFFKGSCLTAVGKSEWDTMRWDGSAALKKSIINDANFSFISIEKPSDHNKHLKALDNQKVKSMLLDCSDAHSFSDAIVKDRIGNSFTWLKADTTFEGLKQVSNDKARIFIGNKPPLIERFETNKTKFIKSLSMNKVDGSTLSESWFDNLKLPFNPSMVAIIGNKGNGKSAIADTLGLVGNTANYIDFSFLNDKKFRKKRPTNKSENFEAIITWADDSTDRQTLDKNPEPSKVEKVKYIPQGFLEKLCNEDVDSFEKELRNVIFSHLSEAERLGKANLNELIDYKTEILKDEIEELKRDIGITNKNLVELERKQSDEYRKAIDEKLKEKENEFRVHELTKPNPVEPPTDPNILQQNKIISDEIDVKRVKLKGLEEDVEKKQSLLKILRLDIAELERTKQTITIFENQFDKLKTEVSPTLIKSGLSFEGTVTLKIDWSKILSIKQKKEKQAEEIQIALGNTDEKGLIFTKTLLLDEIKVLQEKLDEHSRKYQKYIDDLKLWEEKRISIIGSEDKDGTITFLKSQIEYLENKLSNEIDQHREQRIVIVKKLFSKKEEEIALYKSLFRPVSDFIKTYGDVLENYSINLDVDYRINGLAEKFFDHISLGAKGSFIGNPSGIERLNHIVSNHELKTEEGIIAFLFEMIGNLHFDKREDFNGEKRDVEKQLKKGYSVIDLYSFLFNLDYLEPEYKLKLGEKNISELSPGERGALLLIFYLTLDQNDIPLIIDQPEENLDNQSVFKILVQFIKEAKNKRQIIIVTHNPNLAVACNAEQIVHVSIDKQNKNAVQYISGSLEYKPINDAVIDILEGTFPALKTRTNTYKVIERKSSAN
jgi:predicted ATPase